MKLMTLAATVAAMVALGSSAQAHAHHHRTIHRPMNRRFGFHHPGGRRHFGHRQDADYLSRPTYRQASWRRQNSGRGYGPRPSAWCGWEMRQLVSRDPGPAFNRARTWAHWGRGGRAGIGAIVVWPHHVGKIVGRDGEKWVIKSGNDGHRLRTRPRSIAGAIAIIWG